MGTHKETTNIKNPQTISATLEVLSEKIDKKVEIPQDNLKQRVIALLKSQTNQEIIPNALQRKAYFLCDDEHFRKNEQKAEYRTFDEHIQRDDTQNMILQSGKRRIFLTGKYLSGLRDSTEISPSPNHTINILQSDDKTSRELTKEILELFETNFSIQKPQTNNH